jgi:hypothetical protein
MHHAGRSVPVEIGSSAAYIGRLSMRSGAPNAPSPAAIRVRATGMWPRENPRAIAGRVAMRARVS